MAVAPCGEFRRLAMTDAIERKMKIIEAGDGPVLLYADTCRFSGHSPYDAISYRNMTAVEAWRQSDPLVILG